MTAPTGHQERPWGAYLLFVKWARVGATSPSGHLESDYIAESDSEDDARAIAGAFSLSEVRAVLHDLVSQTSAGAAQRKWYDVMNDDSLEQ